jgi:hypothetical protein
MPHNTIIQHSSQRVPNRLPIATSRSSCRVSSCEQFLLKVTSEVGTRARFFLAPRLWCCGGPAVGFNLLRYYKLAICLNVWLNFHQKIYSYLVSFKILRDIFDFLCSQICSVLLFGETLQTCRQHMHVSTQFSILLLKH